MPPERDLYQPLRGIEEFTQAIGMEFGLDKCALIHLKIRHDENYREDAQLVD